ncbi:hypothetical protein MHTCC0001_20700 [Flavobacteriaceae bacterium MHTCC 0001]
MSLNFVNGQDIKPRLVKKEMKRVAHWQIKHFREPFSRNITEDGMLGYVQPIGAAPGKAWADKTEVYGTGAFLAAGSEVYKLYK